MQRFGNFAEAKMTTIYPVKSLAAHAPSLSPGYGSTKKRAPLMPPIAIPAGPSETSGPLYGRDIITLEDCNLTCNKNGEAQGERIVVAGRVLDEDGRPIPDTLVEIWQANAAGRYVHAADTHPAPLDPNFFGAGRAVTDAEGRYRFVTIKPGAYPWRNHANAWRPAHIHFSLFGTSFLSRLVTQMYFPGDPLHELDPILGSVPDPAARSRLVARFDIATTEPEWALGYVWDIVLRGRSATPMEGSDHV
jgi:protocatechuate 3,4-dioxygenase beta subunit